LILAGPNRPRARLGIVDPMRREDKSDAHFAGDDTGRNFRDAAYEL